MLAPDPTGTISQLTLVLNANVAVTQWVMALEAASLPQLNPAPSWYTQVSAALTAAQNDSRGWLTTTGPDIQGEMTQTFINYANLFALVAPDLARVVAQVQKASPPAPPTPTQVQELTELVQALLQKAQAQRETVAGIQGAMDAYHRQMRADHAALRSALAAALAGETKEAAAIQQVQLQIQAVQDAIAALSQDISDSQISAGTSTSGMLASILLNVGEMAAGDVAIGIAGIVGELAEDQIATTEVLGCIGQLRTLMQQLGASQVQLGMLQGVIAGIQRLLDGNDDALGAFDSFLDAWDFTLYGLRYLLVVLAQPQIDVSLIPDLNDLDDATAAWTRLSGFATDVQEMVFTQQATVQLSA